MLGYIRETVISIYPPQNITDKMKQKIMEVTKEISVALKVIGMINIQFIEFKDEYIYNRSKPAFQPYGSLYNQGDRGSGNRIGNQGDVGRDAQRHGIRNRHKSRIKHGSCKGAGILD